MKITSRVILSAVLLSTAVFGCRICGAQEQKTESENIRKIAVFVRNDSADSAVEKGLNGYESRIAAELNARGFSIVDENLALRNLDEYTGKNPSDKEALALRGKDGALNAKLFRGASASRIAEYVGADYVLAVSVVSLDSETRSFDGYGVSTKVETFNMESSCSLFDSEGAGVTGINVGATADVRQGGALKIATNSTLNRLFTLSARSLVEGLTPRLQSATAVKHEKKLYDVNFKFVIESIQFPLLKQQSDGNYEVTSDLVPATLSFATVQIDGAAVSVGKDMRAVKLARGIHTVVADLPDFKKVEESIYVDANTGIADFTISLVPDEKSLERWREDMKFVQTIVSAAIKSDSRRVLTEAEAEKLRGIAETFRKSNISIDLGFGNK